MSGIKYISRTACFDLYKISKYPLPLDAAEELVHAFITFRPGPLQLFISWKL